MTAQQLLQSWGEAQRVAIAAREAYRSAHAKAFAASQGKTGDARKADADAATSAERMKRDETELAATLAWELYQLAKLELGTVPSREAA